MAARTAIRQIDLDGPQPSLPLPEQGPSAPHRPGLGPESGVLYRLCRLKRPVIHEIELSPLNPGRLFMHPATGNLGLPGRVVGFGR